MARILVIDDEVDMLENYRRLLQTRDWSVVTCDDARDALHRLETETFDFILTDLRMPNCDGIQVVRKAREVDPSAVVVIVTAHASVESAVEAVKEGAYDYLSKPFTGDELAMLVERGLNERRLARENTILRRRLEHDVPAHRIVGESPAVVDLIEKIDRAAQTDATVFVVGESGTGKELVARSLHSKSLRAHAPFVPVDCVSLPRELIERELFGHEKGAYTSADTQRMGLFECADGGTMFLDEISELDIDLQAKLLRVLQERQFRRLGGQRLLDIDVRIIAASNRDPQTAVADGKLREDLLYRLDVIRLHVPPLRERQGDIPLLLHHFLHALCPASRRGPSGFSDLALRILTSYKWPGNVRELYNVVQQAVVLCRDEEISLADLPVHLVDLTGKEEMTGEGTERDYKEARRQWIAEFERRYFSELLRRHDGNVSRAADEAQIDRKTLYRIIRDHGLLDL